MSESSHIIILSVDVIGDGVIGVSDSNVIAAMKKDLEAQAFKYREEGKQVYAKQLAYYAEPTRFDDYDAHELTIDDKTLTEIREFAHNNDVTLYIQSDFEHGRFSNAFSPRTMGEFVNNLKILPRKLGFVSCDIAAESDGRTLVIIGNTLTMRPKPKMAGETWPVFIKHIPDGVDPHTLPPEEKAKIGKKLRLPTRNAKEPKKTKEELTPEQFAVRKKYASFNDSLKTYELTQESQWTDKPQHELPAPPPVARSNSDLVRDALGPDVQIKRAKTIELVGAEIAFATDTDIFVRAPQSGGSQTGAPIVYRLRRTSHDAFANANTGNILNLSIQRGRVTKAQYATELTVEPSEMNSPNSPLYRYDSHFSQTGGNNTSLPPVPENRTVSPPTTHLALPQQLHYSRSVGSISQYSTSQRTSQTPSTSAAQLIPPAQPRGMERFEIIEPGRPTVSRPSVIRRVASAVGLGSCFGIDTAKKTQAEVITELATMTDRDIQNAAAEGRYKLQPPKLDNKKVPGTVVAQTIEGTVYVQTAPRQRTPTFTVVPSNMLPPHIRVEVGKNTPDDFVAREPNDVSIRPTSRRSSFGR